MNSRKFAYLEQFLYSAINLLTPLWSIIRPILRLATALTAATVAFQLTAIEGLGFWLALGAGLMSWNLLFKAPPGFANTVGEIGHSQIADKKIEQGSGLEWDDWDNDPSLRHHSTNFHHHLDD